jgi:hypothetical protein
MPTKRIVVVNENPCRERRVSSERLVLRLLDQEKQKAP